MCHASLFTSSAFPKAELFFACMVVIILSILYISIPLIIQSHQEYIKTQQVLTEITSLRAPSNKLMLSHPKELDKNKKELQTFRQVVDAQIDETILTLQNNGFDVIALQLGTDLKPKLAKASAQHLGSWRKFKLERQNQPKFTPVFENLLNLFQHRL